MLLWGPDSAGAESASAAVPRRWSCCCCCCWWRVGKAVVAGRGFRAWCVLPVGLLLSDAGTPAASWTKLMNLRGHQACAAVSVQYTHSDIIQPVAGCASAAADCRQQQHSTSPFDPLRFLWRCPVAQEVLDLCCKVGLPKDAAHAAAGIVGPTDPCCGCSAHQHCF